MLENVKVAQIKKYKKQSPFFWNFASHHFPPDPHHFPPAPHHSSPAFGLFNFCTFQFLHFFTFALLHLAYIFSKWINWKSIFPKCIFPKCIYPKCISAKCTRLACLLSFASLFYYLVFWCWLYFWPQDICRWFGVLVLIIILASNVIQGLVNIMAFSVLASRSFQISNSKILPLLKAWFQGILFGPNGHS